MKTKKAEDLPPQYEDRKPEPYLKYQEEVTDDLVPPRRSWYFFWKQRKKPFIYAKIIFPNRRVMAKPVWIKRLGYFKGLGKAYVVSQAAIYTELINGTLRPVSYYFWDNPEPIKFNPERTDGLETEKSFKELLETKVVQEMASGQPTWIWILVVIFLAAILIMCLIIIVKVSGGNAPVKP